MTFLAVEMAPSETIYVAWFVDGEFRLFKIDPDGRITMLPKWQLDRAEE